MTTFAVTMVKNEDDVIGPVLSHMITQVDHVIVADNLSTDGTREILESFGDSVTVLDDTDPAYEQSKKMSNLARAAMFRGADWIVPFDADEFWYSPHFPTIAEALERLDCEVANADLYNHVASSEDDHTDPNPLSRMGWRWKKPGELPKVAARAHEQLTIHMGNHGVDYGDMRFATARDVLCLRHFPYRTPQQFVNKVRQGAEALRRTDLPPHMGAHWREYAAILESQGELAIYDIFYKFFWAAEPSTDERFVHDPAAGHLI